MPLKLNRLNDTFYIDFRFIGFQVDSLAHQVIRCCCCCCCRCFCFFRQPHDAHSVPGFIRKWLWKLRRVCANNIHEQNCTPHHSSIMTNAIFFSLFLSLDCVYSAARAITFLRIFANDQLRSIVIGPELVLIRFAGNCCIQWWSNMLEHKQMSPTVTEHCVLHFKLFLGCTYARAQYVSTLCRLCTTQRRPPADFTSSSSRYITAMSKTVGLFCLYSDAKKKKCSKISVKSSSTKLRCGAAMRMNATTCAISPQEQNRYAAAWKINNCFVNTISLVHHFAHTRMLFVAVAGTGAGCLRRGFSPLMTEHNCRAAAVTSVCCLTAFCQ